MIFIMCLVRYFFANYHFRKGYNRANSYWRRHRAHVQHVKDLTASTVSYWLGVAP